MGPRDNVLTRGTLIDSSSDETDETFGLYGGYAFAQHIAVELAYADLGEASCTEVHEFADFPFPPSLPKLPCNETGTTPWCRVQPRCSRFWLPLCWWHAGSIWYQLAAGKPAAST
jgi:hypothetical protein